MHPALAAVFDEHESPTHVGKRAVHDGLAPLMAVVAKIEHQMIEYKSKVDSAMLSEHDPALDGTIENIRTTFRATEDHARAFAEAGREIAKDFAQIDRYLAEKKASIARALEVP